MIEFTCPHCNQLLQIPEKYLGQTGKCNKCSKTITVVVAPPPVTPETKSKPKKKNAPKKKAPVGPDSAFLSPLEDDPKITKRVKKDVERDMTNEDLRSLHSSLYGLIKKYYKERNTRDNAISMTVAACNYHVAMSEELAAYFPADDRRRRKRLRGRGFDYPDREPDPLPPHIGFERLAFIRDKQGRQEEAIELCEQAKSQGWHGDWDKRIERYKKKLATHKD